MLYFKNYHSITWKLRFKRCIHFRNLLTPALGISLNYLRLDSNAISNDLADGIFDNLLNLKTLVLDKNKDIKLSNKVSVYFVL